MSLPYVSDRDFETRGIITNETIKSRLDAAGIKYNTKILRKDLIKLYKTNMKPSKTTPKKTTTLKKTTSPGKVIDAKKTATPKKATSPKKTTKVIPKKTPIVKKPVSPKKAPVAKKPVSPKKAPVVKKHVSPKKTPVVKKHVSPKKAPVAKKPVSPKKAPVVKKPVSPKKATSPKKIPTSPLDKLLTQIITNPSILKDKKNTDEFRKLLGKEKIPELRKLAATHKINLPAKILKTQIIDIIVDHFEKKVPKGKPPVINDKNDTKMKEVMDFVQRSPLLVNPEVRIVPPSIFDPQYKQTDFPYTYPDTKIAGIIKNQLYIQTNMDNGLTYSNRYYLPDFAYWGKDLSEVTKLRGYNPKNLEFDDLLQILWWENLFGAQDLLSAPLKSYVSQLDQKTLLKILAKTNYVGPTDVASLIWAIVKRRESPIFEVSPQTNYKLDPDHPHVLKIAVFLHDYYGLKSGSPSLYTPYRYLSFFPKSKLAPYILDYGKPGKNINSYAAELGIIFPTGYHLNPDKKRYFFSNLRDYEETLDVDQTRGVPPMTGLTAPQIKAQLKKYTDQNLVDYFEMQIRNWTSRNHLLDILVTHLASPPIFFIRNKHCNNDDRINIATGDKREKNDENDPIIAYGHLRNYKCFNLEELEMSFREDPKLGFQFFVPDWQKGDLKDLFTMDEIKQLRALLIEKIQFDANNKKIYQPLIDKIDQGIDYANDANKKIKSLKVEYDKFSAADQERIQDYFGWLFFYSMAMRFWKGPGFEYPLIWIEIVAEKRCDVFTRDENVEYVSGIRTSILDTMSPSIQKWILNVPRILYNFRTKEVSLGTEKINDIIEKIIAGNFCLAAGSDLILQTVYYILTRLFGMTETGVNQFLKDQILRLYQLYEMPSEKITLDSILKNFDNPKFPEASLKILLQRLVKRLYVGKIPTEFPTNGKRERLKKYTLDLKKGLPTVQKQKVTSLTSAIKNQPPFSAPQVTGSRHRDPFFTGEQVW